MERSKSGNNWFNSVFDSFSVPTGKRKSTRGDKKRGRDDEMGLPAPKRSSLSFPQDQTWIERHKPTTTSHLAVQPKKIEEVRDWLLNHANGGILLLNGPPGCGKTAVIHQLAAENQFILEEWTTPVDLREYNADAKYVFDRVYQYDDQFLASSQTQEFKNWLKKAKFSGLGLGAGLKLVLLEDLPTFVTRKPAEFQSILLSYAAAKQNPPLVIICSDEPNGNQSIDKLVFKPDFLAKTGCDVISLNAATNTNLIKMLTRIATDESKRGDIKFKIPDKTALESLVESTGNDIRACINALQFSCLNNMNDFSAIFQQSIETSTSSSSKQTKKSGKRGKTATSAVKAGQSSVGSKDKPLDLFHALGKILYAKRGDELEKEKLPPHLEQHARNPCLAQPEDVFDKSTISEDGFACFLHHNYSDFYSDVHDISRLSEYFSSCDLLLDEWGVGGKQNTAEYGVSVASRAVMFCNQHPAKVSGMRKITKPEFYAVKRTIANNNDRLQTVISGRDISQSRLELYTSTLPSIANLKPRSIPFQKMAIIQDIGKIAGVSTATPAAVNGNQQDPDDLFSEDDELINDLFNAEDVSQGKNNEAKGTTEEEDCVIEDFDDD